jgi:hypothetical protein
MFQPFDLVRLVHGVPDAGLPPGTVAVVLEASAEPEPHYEVEVTDGDGRTIFFGGVAAADVAPHGNPG